jgi:hypothetical protein
MEVLKKSGNYIPKTDKDYLHKKTFQSDIDILYIA